MRIYIRLALINRKSLIKQVTLGMRISDRICGVLAGVIMIYGGICISVSEFPVVGIRAGFVAPIGHWFGWVSILLGIVIAVMNIRGFSVDKKKRLAAIARCKARRAQEAEAVKTEDNQHP